MKYTLPKEKKDSLISKISEYLRGNKRDIIAAYFFGSFSTEKIFSDIDIAILLRDNIAQPLNFEITLESELENMIGYPMDIRLLNHAPLSFSQNVIRTGTLIMDADPNIRAEFQGRILKEYFDFSRFHKRYLKEVINAPV